MSFDRLHEAVLHQLTGCRYVVIHALHVALCESIPKTARGRPIRRTLWAQLVLTLIKLRLDLPYRTIEVMFRLDAVTAYRDVRRILAMLSWGTFQRNAATPASRVAADFMPGFLGAAWLQVEEDRGRFAASADIHLNPRATDGVSVIAAIDTADADIAIERGHAELLDQVAFRVCCAAIDRLRCAVIARRERCGVQRGSRSCQVLKRHVPVVAREFSDREVIVVTFSPP